MFTSEAIERIFMGRKARKYKLLILYSFIFVTLSCHVSLILSESRIKSNIQHFTSKVLVFE